MEVIAFVLLALFIAIVIFVNAFYRSSKSYRNRLYVLPDLGIQNHSGSFNEDMLTLIRHLETSLSESYVERVKERMIREHKISLTEWENRWFEWKRYLLMTALLKSVPMYSREVDEVWHEMLMFTREYEDFSREFLGTMLHHAPHASNQSFNSHERAWFDVIYVLLFKPTKYSMATWGPFLQMKHPLSKTLLNDFKKMPLSYLSQKYFNEEVPLTAGLVRLIIEYLKKSLLEIEKYAIQKGQDLKFSKDKSLHPPDLDKSLKKLNGFLFLLLLKPSKRGKRRGSRYTHFSDFSGGNSGDSGGNSCSSSSCSSCGGGGGCGSS